MFIYRIYSIDKRPDFIVVVDAVVVAKTLKGAFSEAHVSYTQSKDGHKLGVYTGAKERPHIVVRTEQYNPIPAPEAPKE